MSEEDLYLYIKKIDDWIDSSKTLDFYWNQNREYLGYFFFKFFLFDVSFPFKDVCLFCWKCLFSWMVSTSSLGHIIHLLRSFFSLKSRHLFGNLSRRLFIAKYILRNANVTAQNRKLKATATIITKSPKSNLQITFQATLVIFCSPDRLFLIYDILATC